MRLKTLKAINHFTRLMCPQRCLFFLKWKQNQSSWKIKSNLSFTADCYATAFKMHKSVYSCSFVTDAWHVHWRRANLQDFCSASFVVKTPVCACDDRDVSSVDDRYKISWQLETVVSREKCLISLPSARARRAWSCHFHLLHYFLFSSTPARSGPIKLCCSLWPVILNHSTLVPHQRPVHE